MPQDLHVVRCCACETFQVDIVKKIPKWVCKMCGEKQSLKKIYGKGTGKECRKFVQDLNEQRLTLRSRLLENSETNQPDMDNDNDDDIEKHNMKKIKLDDGNKPSKWDSFLRNDVRHDDIKCENNQSNASPNRIFSRNITSTTEYNNKFGDVSNLDLDLAF